MRARIYATTADLAEQYRITEETVRSRVRSGEWPADRIGRLIRFSPEQQDQIAVGIATVKATHRSDDRIADILARLAS